MANVLEVSDQENGISYFLESRENENASWKCCEKFPKEMMMHEIKEALEFCRKFFPSWEYRVVGVGYTKVIDW